MHLKCVIFRLRGKTWEDWHETVQKMHPVKYFIAETATDFLQQKIWWRLKHPVEKFHYWFVSHFVPSRRYHMLDLRQPCPKGEMNVDCYKYGWRDVDARMLFAMFNLLNEFVTGELPHYYCPTEEDVAKDPTLKEQRNVVLEVNAIHHWWNVTRKEDHRAYDSLLHQWSQIRKISGKTEEAARLFKILGTVEKDNEDKVDEMIARLMKIRRSLWT
jgi:hypothetical protein